MLLGGTGNDTLRGDRGRDYLNGGNNNDVLIGNTGDDVLIGGNGRDIFLLNDYTYGTDTIGDFNLNDDRIGLGNGINYNALSIGGNANAILSFNGNRIAVLNNISPDSLNEDHFKQL